MKKHLPVEFIYQIFSLILVIIIVHGIYVSVIRPAADAELRADQIAMQENPDYVPTRSVYVIVRDFEQEACFVLFLWAVSIMGLKGWSVRRQRELLDLDLVPVSDGMRILPEDTREYARQLQALPERVADFALPRALLTALQRFDSTRNVQDVSQAAYEVCDEEADRLDSELSMIRYIAWAIPSIGFIGTVRGIGEALAQAHKAVEGDIGGVTQALGVAFNSTFIALLLSIVLMFLVHQLQLSQERLVRDSKTYCDRNLVRHMKAR
ncbi:MAG: MotA/TolQ/ExbB proton channel family protein [Gammaproteobacteria bacterium]|jgi:biopolymer transport protein ExbB/TolQ